jgi:hypothetical protein
VIFEWSGNLCDDTPIHTHTPIRPYTHTFFLRTSALPRRFHATVPSGDLVKEKIVSLTRLETNKTKALTPTFLFSLRVSQQVRKRKHRKNAQEESTREDKHARGSNLYFACPAARVSSLFSSSVHALCVLRECLVFLWA